MRKFILYAFFMTIIEARIEHLDQIIPLFDAYRVFYKQASDPKAAKDFLHERFLKKESIIYLALIDNKAVGFTQLYPAFSSVSMQQAYILNDLFVNSDYRRQGIGEALLNKAKAMCVNNNYKGLMLETAADNPAQHLYERLGWERETNLCYVWNNTHLHL